MHNTIVSALVFAVFVIPGASAAPQMPAPTGKTFMLAGEMLTGFKNLQRNLTEAAAKMPDDQYSFKPTPDIRPFGQLVAHVALAQFGTCSALKGEPNPKKEDKEDASRTKTEAAALLKASGDYCEPVVSTLTDPTLTELTKIGQNQAAKGLLLVGILTHGNEMYGTMAVYLRLKGIVPPSTERQKEMMKKS